MNARTLIAYGLIASLVVIVGVLAGWYFFLRGQTAATTAASTARGFDSAAPLGSPDGSTYQNMLPADSSGFSNAGSAKPTSKPVATLWHADKTPVAGFAFSGDASSTKLVFVERGNGYVFSAPLAGQSVTRITNTLMAKTYEAYFTAAGYVLLRSIGPDGGVTTFLGHIATTSAQLSGSTPTELNGDYLGKNIRDITSNPTTGELFFITGSIPDIAGVRATSAGTKQTTVFSSAVPDWHARWLADGRIILQTLPADGTPGFAYSLSQSGSLEPLIGNVPGLTLLPRSGTPSAMLYGSSSGNRLSLFAQAGSGAPALLPVKTAADKCAWAPAGTASTSSLIAYCAVPQVAPTGTFLDDWYKGVAHTADTWWKIDASSGSAELVYTPDPSISLDVMDPAVDPSGKYLVFLNARDNSLWVLNLAQ